MKAPAARVGRAVQADYTFRVSGCQPLQHTGDRSCQNLQMRRSLRLLTLVLLLGSAGPSFALPLCLAEKHRDNCFGANTYSDGSNT